MPNKYANGKKAIAQCDRCGFRYKLKQLKRLVIKTKNVNILVCPECWEPDHPQLMLGMYPVSDPQALRLPRPDSMATDGSRVSQWGWNPVGLGNVYGEDNDLVMTCSVGTVTVTTT
jgi:hypothetical protein